MCTLVSKSTLLPTSTTYVVIILFCTLSNFIFIMACTKHTSFKYLVDIGKRTDYFLHFLEEDRTIVKKERFRLLWWNLLPAFTCIFVRGEEKNAKVFPEDIFPHISKGSCSISLLILLSLEKGALPKHKSLLSHVLLVIWKNDTYTW